MTFTSSSTRLKTLVLGVTLSALLGSVASAQSETPEVVDDTASSQISYDFKNVVFPGDNFVQLLGINHDDEIAGYHGSGAVGHPNQGFTFTLPNNFVTENVVHAAQTQVIGINNAKNTDGFFVDQAGVTHGFMMLKGQMKTIDYPGFTFTQLLGLNNYDQAAGYYADANGIDHAFLFNKHGNVFEVLTIPIATGGAQATGVNDKGWLSGFFIDKAGVNHGFLLAQGRLSILNFPDSTFTQALGVNNNGDVVGFYLDMGGLSHGFLLHKGRYSSVDDPNGVGTTVVNGINDEGKIVGFYVDSKGNTDSFVGKPDNY